MCPGGAGITPAGIDRAAQLLGNDALHIRAELGRGADRLPGEFRRSQNWIAGTRPSNAWFAPPWPTCSSRPSTRFSMATAASAGC